MEYWADQVDTELNQLGALTGTRDEILGLAVHSERKLVELLVSADLNPSQMAEIERLSESISNGELTVSVRRSKHTSSDLRRANDIILHGRWKRDIVSPAGPMAFSYLAKSDAVEISLPSSARVAGERLEAELQDLGNVVYEADFDSTGRPRMGR